MLRLGSVKTILFAVLLLLASTAYSDSLDDGFVAFKQGDKELAYKSWLPLAIQGNVRAQFLLSVLYEQWPEAAESKANAIKWLTAAANNGFIPAQFNLGNNYRLGRYGMVDNKMAVYWWEQAAVQGFVEAQYRLATIYFTGDGIRRNLKEAAYWYDKAASNGSVEAADAIAKIRSGTYVRLQGDVATNVPYDDPQIISPQLSLDASKAVSPEPTDQVADTPEIEPSPVPDSPIDNSMPEQASNSASVVKTEEAVISTDEKQQKPSVVEKEETTLPAAETPPASSNQDWVLQQPAGNYTIQLLASKRMSNCEDNVTQLHQRYNLDAHTHAFALKGQQLCSVTYGSYGSRAEANAGMKQLPQKIRQAKPWVRKLGELQDLAISL